MKRNALALLACILAATAYAQPRMGTNLHEPKDWSNALVSTDLVYQARDWFSGTSATFNDGRVIPVDVNGWPTRLESGQWARTVLSTNANRQPAGTYTVRFDGAGTVAIIGIPNAKVSSVSPFTVDIPQSFSILTAEIRATDPANPVRNLQVLTPGATGPGWYPPFIESLQGYAALRFMDWARTNNTPEYNGPAPADYFTLASHAKGGASPAAMAELCNTVNADLWFCVHDLATPAQIRQAAEMIRDTLDPGLKVYVEWSNEIWNNPFQQAKRALAAGAAMFPSEPDTNRARYWYQGVKSEEAFAIFEDVLGDDRVINVVAAQAANVWTAIQIETRTPNMEAIASAPYYRDAPRTIDGWVRDWMVNYRSFATTHGVPHIAYEGGQHFVNETIGGMTVAASHAYNRSEQAGIDYRQYFAQWAELGGGLFMHFAHIGHIPNNNGAWASFDSFAVPDTPKHRAIRDTLAAWAGIEPEPTPEPNILEVPFTATDGNGGTVSGTLRIEVIRDAEPEPTPEPEPNSPPVITAIRDAQARPGDVLDIRDFVDVSDPDGDVVSLAIIPGNGYSVAGVEITIL